MRTVNVADLQNDLTTYVDYARAGEEVIIRDDDHAVAKLIPFAGNECGEENLAPLLQKPFDVEAFHSLPIGKVKDGFSAVQALIDDREDRV